MVERKAVYLFTVIFKNWCICSHTDFQKLVYTENKLVYTKN